MTGSDIQKTNVTLKMLIESKILSPGIELICAKPGIKALLNKDGSIKVFVDGNNKVFEYLSGAARYIEKKSVNGWIYWRTVTREGQVPLSEFRDKYIALKQNV